MMLIVNNKQKEYVVIIIIIIKSHADWRGREIKFGTTPKICFSNAMVCREKGWGSEVGMRGARDYGPAYSL